MINSIRFFSCLNFSVYTEMNVFVNFFFALRFLRNSDQFDLNIFGLCFICTVHENLPGLGVLSPRNVKSI